MICIPQQILLGLSLEEDEMGGAFDTHMGEGKWIQGFCWNT
jgi:hypothetical protein